MNLRSAVSRINRQGILLVFPVNNRKEPKSLWFEFHPRTPMRWEWDQEGDSRVSDLWHLRERLSRSDQVVYCKWYRGRATVLSFEVYVALLKLLGRPPARPLGLSLAANEIMDLLEEDSPLSTRQIKSLADLTGRTRESMYNRAMKELWSRLLIVGYGEVDEGSFPSLAVGASRLIFEECWLKASRQTEEAARVVVDARLPKGSPFRRYFDQVEKEVRALKDGGEQNVWT